MGQSSPTTARVTMQIPRAFKWLEGDDYRYGIIYGGRGSLKSHTVARYLLLTGRKKKVRILCTREYQKSIKNSVHKLLSDLILQYGFTDYDVQNTTITNRNTGTEFIFTGLHDNAVEIKSMEGIDICWVEEGHATTKESWDILTPTIRKAGSKIIVTFNRMYELDPVYVKFILNPPKRTISMKVNYDYAERLGWFPDVLREEMEEDRENHPADYAHKWLGEPLSQTDDAILDRTSVLEAMDREADDTGQEIVGADIARLGSDRIVLWKRKGLRTIKTAIFSKLRVTETAEKIKEFVEYNKTTEIRVDDTGVGGGVTDILIADGYNVVAINFGARALDADKYPNWISEAWFHIEQIISTISIPQSDDLLQELTTRKKKMDNQGRRRVESKDEYKKRGFRSPDLADAMIICYAPAQPKMDWAAPDF